MFRSISFLSVVWACAGWSSATPPAIANGDSTTFSVAFSPSHRTARLAEARIQGICGGPRLADAVARGANTVRTYAAPSRDELDRYHSLGVRVIVGHWMPHQGTNIGKEGWPWEHSYDATADAMARDFAADVDRIGDHPAIVMWSLGNEVRLEPEYLQQADRLSRILHARHPSLPTSLTMVNAPAEGIALVKQYAPDVDVIGVNSYGAGAVANSIAALQKHWGKAFYFSEFGPTGPWWGPETTWGARFEAGASAKTSDLAKAWDHIASAEGCLGGCGFLWGRWQRERITYFSMLLPANPWSVDHGEEDLRFTPLADELSLCWKGRRPKRQAPRLERIAIDGATQRDIVVTPAQKLAVTAQAMDSDSAPHHLRYRWWIACDGRDGFRPVVGPIDSTEPAALITCPDDRGAAFVLMCIVLDDSDGICGTTLPFKTAD